MSFSRIDNDTLMEVGADVLDDRSGRQVLVVIAKMTFQVGLAGEIAVAARPSPVRDEDEWLGEPLASSLRYPSDLVPEKPGTDVLLLGTALPPADRAVTSIDVRLLVADQRNPIQKTARVHGPRVYAAGLTGVIPGAPARLAPTPLVWELAYGGTDRSDPGDTLVEVQNPIGTGVARERFALAGRAAPPLEDPAHPLTSRAPEPACFGPIPAHWAPRALFAGTFDERWRRDRAPLPPADRDPRFYCSAPAGQWSSVPLLGDEPVEILGVTPSGRWIFQLPRYAPVFSCIVRGAAQSCATHLDTLLIDADLGRVELTYRTRIAVQRKVQAIDRVTIVESAPLPAGLEREASSEEAE
jgi:hypothetical protein